MYLSKEHEMNKVLRVTAKNKFSLIVVLLMCVGILVRIYALGVIPGGLNQDEAFAGYEAYSLLNYGIDSQGNHNPVYLSVWGSGMSALYSYLCMPFIKLLGLNPLATRLPSAIISIVALICFYMLSKKLINHKFAVLALFLLSINPWHIMSSRWGLDADLSSNMILIALTLFLYGLDNQKLLPLSALFYGLTLYCYATFWIAIPFILLSYIVYCLYYKKLFVNRWLVLSVVILFVMALPLLLFILVNSGIINEIRCAILSIPKLPGYRGSEIGLINWPQKVYKLFRLLVTQQDNLYCTTSTEYGLHYLISGPFCLLGVVTMCQVLLHNDKSKVSNYNFLFFPLAQLVIGIVILTLVQDANNVKIQILHLPTILMCAYGIWFLKEYIPKTAFSSIIALYMLLFICFSGYYFFNYTEETSEQWQEGFDEALDEAKQLTDSTIVISGINYANILYHTKLPVQQFLDTVSYSNYPDPWLDVQSFDRYVMGYDSDALDAKSVYIIRNSDVSWFEEQGYQIKQCKNYSVAYK